MSDLSLGIVLVSASSSRFDNTTPTPNIINAPLPPLILEGGIGQRQKAG